MPILVTVVGMSIDVIVELAKTDSPMAVST